MTPSWRGPAVPLPPPVLRDGSGSTPDLMTSPCRRPENPDFGSPITDPGNVTRKPRSEKIAAIMPD